jgi:hypothetical protein
LGTAAILLGGAAIMVASIEVAIRVWAIGDTVSHLASVDVAVLLIIGSIAAAFGLASVALGVSGTLFGRRKEEWLINRFMGERIRQFHFQSLIAQLPLILAMASAEQDACRTEPCNQEGKRAEKNSTESFLDDRHKRFVAFQADFDDLQREAKFADVVGAGGEADWHLCKPDAFSVPDSEQLKIFFRAYRHLRLQHQLNYAIYKLKGDHKIFSDMPRRHTQLIADINKFGIGLVITVHVGVLLIVAVAFFGWLFGALPNPRWAIIITPIFFFAIMALAVVSLCAHAFAEGLQPEREVERYQQYRSALKTILERFDEIDDPAERIRIMWQMEQTTYEEMRNFLVTHHERSSFAM